LPLTSELMVPLTRESLNFAVEELCHSHPEFDGVVMRHGMPSLRAMEGGLEGLLTIVTEQFLSVQAAAAIWSRFKMHVGVITPQAILQMSGTDFLAVGLSNAKAQSFKAIATAVENGSFEPQTFQLLDDETVKAQLMALKGVGPWTADIYLLSVLLRPNAWPWGDLALQLSAQDLFKLPVRPQNRDMREFGEQFTPWRAVAARLLWSHYRGIKAMKQV
jgi:DNA-3-methyladenine glycosylase II